MGTWAPVFDANRFLRNPIRLPMPKDVTGLQNGKPFWIPIYDTTSVNASTGGVLGANLSGENNYQLAIDWTWLACVASFSQGSAASPPFSFQLFRTTTDAQGAQQGFRYQKTPIDAQCLFGTAQKPFYLRKPVFLPAGTELICRVQNLQAASNAIQVVLYGEIEG